MSWGKFVNEKWEEIKYFDRTDSIFDDSNDEKSKWWQGNKIYKYEIKSVNSSKWTVKIASTFEDINENSETVKCDYENELPFEQFILLMEWKRLKWYTQAEQNEMETKYNINDPKRLPTKWRREWISIWSIINVFKGTTKAIKGKLDEKRKEQDEILENYLFSYEWLNLYSKLWWLLGWLWLTWMSEVMKKSEYEFYTNRENRTWKRIEERYKIFQADPNYSELYKEQLIPILKKPWYRWTDKDRYQFAAAFLMMLKKEWPCPRDFTTEIWKWNWVEKFLWPEHKVRFLNYYEKKKNELEQTKDMWQKKDVRLDLQEELNKLEYMYIFNTIEWNAPHGPDSNEFMLKSIWSTKFSWELKANLGWYFDKHTETKNEMKTFYAAEEQYLRTVWAGRFNKAIPSLERMLELANTPWEVFRAKWYFLAAMLIWIIKNNSTKDTIKSFWGTSRAIWFAPWFWIIDTDSQDKVKIMLDWVTNWEFSNTLWSNLEKYKLWDLQEKNYDFVKDFQSYRNSHGKNILKKVEDPSYKKEDDENDKSVIDLSEDEKNPNAYVFKSLIDNTLTNEIDKTNDQVKSVSLYQKESPLSATNNTMKRYIPNKWQYSRVEKEEDRADAESFWQSIIDKNCIPKGPTTKQKTDFLFEKYFNWFNDTLESSDKKMIVRSIKLIQEQKKEKDDRERNVAKYMLRYMIKWMMHQQLNWSFPPEFETVMNDFVEFFFNNIEHIDSKTIKKTFKNDRDLVREFDNPYRMLNRSQYSRYKMTTLKGNMSSTKTRYSNMMDLWLRKYNLSHSRQEWFQELDVNDFINTPIEAIWKNCDKYWVSPKINISLSKSGIPLDVATETNETLKEKNQMLDKLQDYYDEQEAMAA